jgi:predicted dehydrogenase
MNQAASQAADPDGGRPLRCAVIGVGHMGHLHALKYASMQDWDLVAVVDTEPEVRARIAQRCNTLAVANHAELLGKVDAVSIAVPTSLHHPIARDFLTAGCHVLIEKPIALNVEEADDLIALAQQQGCTLQVGHLERFNAAVMALDLGRSQPRFIEATRLAPFSARGNDVSVVLDLMIHDIDLILDLVGAEVAQLDAVGGQVVTDGIDIANARLVFENGCVANVTASRVSLKVERKMRLFLPDSYVSIDFRNRVFQRHYKGSGTEAQGLPQIISEKRSFETGDALATQIRHFAECIRQHKEPITSGVAGRRALAVAARIGELVEH